MGKTRARTDEELAAGKSEILEAAKEQVFTMDYDAITLATIAEKTSISHPSMYHYYEKKQSIFIDLLIQEYQGLEKDLQPFLKSKMARERFCRKLTSVLWKRQLLLKLMSLQLPVWRRKYNGENLERFVKEALPYQRTLSQVLLRQFPDTSDEARNMFRIQFSVYCNSLYEIENLLRSRMMAMKDQKVFDSIPKAEDICFEGLMLLSAVMVD